MAMGVDGHVGRDSRPPSGVTGITGQVDGLLVGEH